MASLDFEAEKSAFREYHNDNSELLHGAEDFFRSLVVSLLARVSGLEKPTVTSRLKDREECIRKFSRKYQTALEESQNAYEIKDHITDLIGLRVVCLYENEVDLIVSMLRTNFEVLEETNKIKAIESTENAFGYKGFHLDLKINEARREFPEYAQYESLRFEVQVRTTIQDAWSALDHKIKYKRSIPADLKRRINTLAALFELADHEFLSIRDKTKELFQKAQSETKKIAVEGPAPAPAASGAKQAATDLDVFSFISVAEHYFPGYNFISFAADGFVQELLKIKPSLTIEFLSDSLNRHLAKVKKYKAESPHSLNPYTQIRHSLYLEDQDLFKTCLFDMQRAQFDEWLRKA
ncbi:hypothetical protein QAA18_07435 [Luteimonas sp. 8-5]|uniref:GTP pyrophosphokinase n=1 Tax=Luteimonas sp. 8-5 TaxID=3039387 RepID=UPI0024371BE1|nr:hypothetical protein [Luteimonas sp. 8-5]MDG6348575.1 hypothetical protein [Luteimonas sp. 8-5]